MESTATSRCQLERCDSGECCPCCDIEKCPAYRYCWDDKDNKFPPIRTFFLVGAFFFYLLDVGLDIWVAVEHYVALRQGTDEYARYYLGATLFFIVAPLIVINFISWMLYTWGWLVYKSKKIRNYCHTEPLTYVTHNEDRTTHVPVETVQVISSWSWYKKSSTRKTQSSNPPDQLVELQEFNSNQEIKVEFSHPTSDCWVANDEDEQSSNDSEDKGGYVGLPSPQGHARKGSTVPMLEDVDNGSAGDETDGLQFYPLDLFDNSDYIFVSLLHLFQLGYIFRVCRLLYKRKHDRYSFDRYRDLSFLRLMESFLESAPQVVLQLYIVTIKEEARLSYNIVTPISIFVSMCSLALAVADYISAEKDLYYYDPPPNHKRQPRLSWTAYFIIIFWHLSMIAGRTVTFALFASVYGGYVFLVAGLHYVAMIYWTYWQQAHVFITPSTAGGTDQHQHGRIRERARRYSVQRKSLVACLDPRNHICGNYGIEFVVAAFNIFFHFKIKEHNSSLETLVPFYTLTFIENTLMIFLWYYGRDFGVSIWYGIPAIVLVFVTFAIGIALLIIYYVCFQPQNAKNTLQPTNVQHPTMTCTLNRMYESKKRRGSAIESIAIQVSTIFRRS